MNKKEEAKSRLYITKKQYGQLFKQSTELAHAHKQQTELAHAHKQQTMALWQAMRGEPMQPPRLQVLQSECKIQERHLPEEVLHAIQEASEMRKQVTSILPALKNRAPRSAQQIMSKRSAMNVSLRALMRASESKRSIAPALADFGEKTKTLGTCIEEASEHIKSDMQDSLMASNEILMTFSQNQ